MGYGYLYSQISGVFQNIPNSRIIIFLQTPPLPILSFRSCDKRLIRGLIGHIVTW